MTYTSLKFMLFATATLLLYYLVGRKGQKYVLVEDAAPSGYVISKSVEFTVTGEKLSIELGAGHTRVFIHMEEGTAATLRDRYGVCIANWIADKNAYYTEELGSGEYTVNSSGIVVEATLEEQHFYISEDGTVATEKKNNWWIYALTATGAIVIIIIISKKKKDDSEEL